MDIRFGFIHDKFDIKILILFILQRLPDAIDPDSLAELTLCDDGISYFDYAECVAELVESGHVSEENGKYLITEKGRQNGKITESSLPYSVRMKAEKAAAKAANIQRRSAMIRSSHKNRDNGESIVSLSLSDDFGTIMSLELLTGSEDEAKKIENNFHKNAEVLYGQIADIMLME